MTITWSQNAGQEAVSWQAFDGQQLVGQVVRYDEPPGWAAFHRGHRVEGGPWATADEAKAALEVSVARG